MTMKLLLRCGTLMALTVVALLSGRGVARAGTVLPGDLDCNGRVDFDDVDPFVLGMNNPSAYEAQYGISPEAKGDMDGDGDQDFDDIPCFSSTLQGEGCNPTGIPLPPAIWSGLVMLGMLGLYRAVNHARSD
jgi:hypothetical protein